MFVPEKKNLGQTQCSTGVGILLDMVKLFWVGNCYLQLCGSSSSSSSSDNNNNNNLYAGGSTDQSGFQGGLKSKSLLTWLLQQ